MCANYLPLRSQETVTYFLLAVVLLLAAITMAPAQELPQNPDRGAKVGNSFAIGDFEVINTTNGNLMLNFPLGSLPPGRGELGGQVSLVYNSKLWDVKTEKIEDYRGSPRPPYFDKTILYPSSTGGWTLSPGITTIEYEDRRNEYGSALPSCPYGQGDDTGVRMTYVHKVRVALPDGSKHEMVPNGYTDTPFVNDGFYKVSVDGWIENCGGQRTRTGHPMVYRSVDSTYLRLEFSYDYDQVPDNNTWKLYFPDGRTFDGSKMTDRNGNWVSQSYTGVSDQFGRSVSITDVGNDSLVRSKGTGGEDIVWTVRWKTIAVVKNYQSCEPQRCTPEHLRTPLWEALTAVDKIIQPHQLGGGTYKFNYNAPDYTPNPGPSHGWGEISSIELPTGARVSYEYMMDGQDGPENLSLTPEILRNYPRTKTLTYDLEYDGQTTVGGASESWNYSIGAAGSSVVGPDGGVTTETFGVTDAGGLRLPWDSGLSLRRVLPDGTKVEKVWARNFPTACTGCNSAINPYVDKEFISIKDSTGNYVLTAIKDFTYDKNGNMVEFKEYDWAPYEAVPRTSGHPSGLPEGADTLYLKRVTKTEFFNGTPYAESADHSDPDSYHLASSPRLLRLARSSELLDGSGTPGSRTEMTYDYTIYGSNTLGGNVTSTRSWDSFKGGSRRAYSNPLTETNSIVTSTTYTPFGQPETTTDANGTVTRTTYGNVAAPNGVVSHLYPTQTVVAHGTPVARTSSVAYDFYTGLATSTTDEDNNVTNVTEYDAVGRPTRVISAQGTTVESWTRTEYNDNDRYIVVRSDVETVGDGKKVATRFFDQLGRVRLSKTLEDPATQSATNETDGIKVQTRYGLIRDASNGYTYQITSNPYREPFSWQATAEETMGWTRSKAWHHGERQETETFSGASLPAPWGGNANSTGVLVTEKDANRTTITDQARRKRRNITDSFGQLTRVDEPNGAGEIGSVSAPAQPTYYSYSTDGKMVRVRQGVQNRYFMHDSLGRLLRVRQPEQTVNPELNTVGNADNNSWTAGFIYDANGNLITSRDAKNVAITTMYDRLNRPASRTYSDATPAVSFTYDDPSVARSKGKLTKMASANSEMLYLGFDAAGRLTASQQSSDGRVFPSNYKYDLAGSLTEQTYPSGRVVKTLLETDGDISAVSSKVADGPFKNYASNFAYTPAGAIRHLQLGNGLWESARLNSRGQTTELNLGNSPVDGGLWKLNYHYGELDPNGNVDASRNTGNITKQTIRLAGLSTPFIQTYRYDPLYRISEAREVNNGSPTWVQNFIYDRYGNRVGLSQIAGGQQLPVNNLTLPQVDVNTNRFQSGQGYSYDPAGNLIGDPQGREFIFNGDNKQVEIRDANGDLIGEYVYDGNGKRVKKVTPAETVIFVYDGLGKLVAEMSTAVPPVQPTVIYTATDPLGSPRVLTNKQGQVVSRRDFMPFGEELAFDATYRTADRKYGAVDNVRQRFTGYPRDEESGLDFAEARYYNMNHGRFTAVDPLLASGKSDDPQTFNRYAYSINRPLVLTDPTGQQCGKEPIEDDGTEEGEGVPVNTLVVGAEKENALAIKIAQQLNAAHFKEQGIIKAAAINQRSEVKKALIKDFAESFDPTISVSAGLTGPTGGVTINMPSPARPLEALFLSPVDTQSQIALNRIDAEAKVNTSLADASVDYQIRKIEPEEIKRSLTASANLAIKMHKIAVDSSPRYRP
jgi:RHS repeat-associated protein